MNFDYDSCKASFHSWNVQRSLAYFSSNHLLAIARLWFSLQKYYVKLKQQLNINLNSILNVKTHTQIE